jgi:predicted TIM-barrel fold metal-dependent hydrolase
VAALPGLIRQLVPFGVPLVIDHFGRPDARLGADQPGFSELMTLGLGDQLWVKISGIYRLAGTDRQNLEFARAALALLEQSFGRDRLVWGSDWPHTQHEASVGFDATATGAEKFGVAPARADGRNTAGIVRILISVEGSSNFPELAGWIGI